MPHLHCEFVGKIHPATTMGFAAGKFTWQLVLTLAVGAWAIVAVLRIGGLASSLARLQSIVRRAHAVTPQIAPTLLDRIQRRVGLAEPLKLRESVDVSAPLAAGIIGNYILVPAGWTNRLSRTELDSVLCHEAAHLARRDHRVVLLQELLASLLWFHPLVHLGIIVRLTRAREEICDNYAIRSIDRPAYCAALFRLASGRNHDSLLAATSLSSRHWPLEERIRGILDESRPTVTGISRSTRSAIFSLAICLCGLTAIPALTAAEPELKTMDKAALEGGVEVRHVRGKQTIADDIRSIRVTSDDGSLQIGAAPDAKLQIEAIVHIDTKRVDASSLGNSLDDFVQISSQDGALTITPRVDVDKPNKGLSVDLSIAVPAGLAIEAQINNGNIAVSQDEAKLSLTTHDGDIAVKSNAISSLTATSHDGNIAVDTPAATGKIALSAHDGSIAVHADAIGGDLNVEAFDGNVTVEAGRADGPLYAVSHDGSVTVALTDPTAGAGEISLTSQDGDVVFTAASATKVAANTAQGSIVLHLTGSGIKEGLSAATAEGDVKLMVSPETNADLALVTHDGEITIDGQQPSGNIISTRLGKGGPKYAIATEGGSILVKTVDAKSPANP